MRISDWSSDVCSSDLMVCVVDGPGRKPAKARLESQQRDLCLRARAHGSHGRADDRGNRRGPGGRRQVTRRSATLWPREVPLMTTQALDRTDDGAGRAFWSDAIFVIAVAFAVFHLYTGAFGLLEGIKQRVIHLGFALVLVFLSRPLSNAKSPRTIDVVLAVLALVPSAYLVMEDSDLAMRMGLAYDRDGILGTIMVVVLLEATRRVAGLALPMIAGLPIA